jgi:hypothetical protein
MAVGDIIQMRIECHSEPQVSQNVRHFIISVENPPAATLQQMAAALNTIFAPLYKNVLNANAFFRGVGTRRVHPPPLTLEATTDDSAGLGLILGDQLPAQVSGIITLKTQFAGRAYRGRVYIPFPGEASNTASATPDATYLSNLNLLGSAFITGVVVPNGAGNSTLTPVIFHRVNKLTTVLLDFTARPVWATQRRRGDYGRPNTPTI